VELTKEDEDVIPDATTVIRLKNDRTGECSTMGIEETKYETVKGNKGGYL
jgi:hypothetical protein